eukprot:CAMPEP_0113822136 /NCGR_PEP_ID=MMETSP0328-20130328/2089_1 /TAXON_ID=39455 /ORGANISM="Alexandrium minutum" /LENGTH=416 /DNA_ID=CAMNT_0000790071 /DNA_START=60 /DNA_END=1305 /DNA_ORIENTATION=- /assembly_acc=CAM_ASM_000350
MAATSQVGYAFEPRHRGKRASIQERPGLHCAPTLPSGAVPMALAPPILPVNGTIDMTNPSSSEALRDWATSSRGGGGGAYRRYAQVGSVLPVLGAVGVPEVVIARAVDCVSHFLTSSARNPQRLLAELAGAGARIALAPRTDEPSDAWRGNPEVRADFATGLGGGSRLFPTTGAQVDGSCDGWFELMEELFHTIQYVAMPPTEVCLYHMAYREAVEQGRYHPEVLEQDGEPVPTMQADEYFASAFIAWFGGAPAPKEYPVPHNGPGGTGRAALLRYDPVVFCLLARRFWANDTWTPCTTGRLRNFPNQAVPFNQTECDTLLSARLASCPAWNATWPHPSLGPSSLAAYDPRTAERHALGHSDLGLVLRAGTVILGLLLSVVLVSVVLLYRRHPGRCPYEAVPQAEGQKKAARVVGA